ncbi:MAG: serine protease [Clostridium perfringens]|nr:serine protease [Clostridium perfringens]
MIEEKEKYINNLSKMLINQGVQIMDGVSGKMGRRGSGVIVDKEGYIFTTYELVGDLENVSPIVTLNTREEIIGKVVYKNKNNNLAIIKINRTFDESLVASFGSESEVFIGSHVVIVRQIYKKDENIITLGNIINSMRQYKTLDINYNVKVNGYIQQENKKITPKGLIEILAETDKYACGAGIFDIKGNLIGMLSKPLIDKCTNKESTVMSIATPVSIMKEVFSDYKIESMMVNNININEYL